MGAALRSGRGGRGGTSRGRRARVLHAARRDRRLGAQSAGASDAEEAGSLGPGTARSGRCAGSGGEVRRGAVYGVRHVPTLRGGRGASWALALAQ